ncbi:DUF3857 domain-containing transglutaminase family protein [Reichenbachiella agariperforans]|uniref:DUF3857 domain-containing transglutaminase family protein n=1 Tax=Reichenbachiella agariperforans TaxID=156994 RepID=UPI001C09BCC6|nr:DUF3857 domain-containing transglutaminase family protein [Reichenbachiella agariperforans]MBU2914649.1 DUF3857 domain-containing transglutaminase family protein [Reichenbachiella agariperforans]
MNWKYKKWMSWCYVALSSFSLAQAQTYRIDQIPDSLKENANAVYLLDEVTFEIIDEKKAIYHSHQVIAILNAKAKRLASETIGYDKLTKINSFTGKRYNQFGKLVAKSKKSDIYDRSATSGGTIFDDSRYQHLDLTQNQYPYIVEFEYEEERAYTYSIPDWYISPTSNLAVVESNYTVIAPDELQPNFKLVNTNKTLNIVSQDGITTSSISFAHVKAVEHEPYGPPVSDFTPVIYASPSAFHYDGYSGDFNSWHNMGLWQLRLNQGRGDLSQTTIQEVKALTTNLSTDEEKIKAVYQYVQNKTRYVSIQLGIGGMQPFPASTVDELGYGDCKALSNYTHALLQSIGIESYYTLVYGGDRPPVRQLDFDFPVDVFNHIILCVPNQQDTIWLECTSQTNPFGYQGEFTGDRDVLLITPEGGKIAHTTIYDKTVNRQESYATVQILEDGNATANLQIKYSGLQYENGNLNWIINDGDEKLEKWIYKNTDISEFQIVDFDFVETKDKIPTIMETAQLNIRSLAADQGKRLFLSPNLMNQWKTKPKRVTNRQTDMVLTFEYTDTDSIVYQLPEKYHIEYLPESTNIETQFGTYQNNYQFENHQLIYTRRLEKNKGRFSKEAYEEYRQFCEDIIQADKGKVVFVDKT